MSCLQRRRLHLGGHATWTSSHSYSKSSLLVQVRRGTRVTAITTSLRSQHTWSNTSRPLGPRSSANHHHPPNTSDRRPRVWPRCRLPTTQLKPQNRGPSAHACVPDHRAPRCMLYLQPVCTRILSTGGGGPTNRRRTDVPEAPRLRRRTRSGSDVAASRPAGVRGAPANVAIRGLGVCVLFALSPLSSARRRLAHRAAVER